MKGKYLLYNNNIMLETLQSVCRGISLDSGIDDNITVSVDFNGF